jgi:hypothetical protein
MIAKNERKAKCGFWGIIVVGAFLLVYVQPVQAVPVTIQIEAVVDTVEDSGNYLGGLVDVCDVITGYYTYESTTPDSSPSDPVQGNYWNYSLPSGVYLSVGDFDFRTNTNDIEFNVFIRNDNSSGHDIYGFDSLNNFPLSNGTIVDTIYWSLKDYTASVFSSDALPTTAPILDQWEENLLRFITDREFLIDAHVTSAEVVPEPSTVFLLIFGSIFLRKRFH